MQRNIITTTDGSHSIFIPELNEHYHSIHGAIQESRHVFIETGLKHVSKDNSHINIFEVGFGTGLNALLTFLESELSGLKINYTSVEAYPVENAISSLLNYSEELNIAKKIFDLMHSCEWEKENKLAEHFSLHKIKSTLQNITLPENQFDLIYFDAFGPPVQPEMWTDHVFEKLFVSMKTGSSLTTYCAKGEVKRVLKRAGFSVESLPGPPRKREIVRATKI